MLRSSLGIALIYAIRQRNGMIGLPEVIEREVEKHCLLVGLDAVAAAKKAQRQLERLLDRTVVLGVPDEHDIRRAIQDRMRQLEPLLHRVPLTIEHARSALDRVNKGIAPNARRQEYKDSLIWEATLGLGQTFDVCLITDDSGFFSGEMLASSLREECALRDLSIRGFRRVEACLMELAPTPPTTYSKVRAIIASSLRDWAERQLVDFRGKVTEEVEMQFFATENPLQAAVAFTAQGNLMGNASKPSIGEREGTFELQASGTVDITDGSILDLSGPRAHFVWETPPSEGTKFRPISMYASGGTGFVVAGPTFETFRDMNWLRGEDAE